MKILCILVIGIVIISTCFYQLSAEASDAQDCYDAGVRYNKAKDYAEAIKWFIKSADQGNAKAQVGLGLMHYEGRGVSQDYAEAVKWYLKAANQGKADAQRELGTMYYSGEGVPKNLIEAKNWFGKAAAQGDEDALKMMKKLTEMNF